MGGRESKRRKFRKTWRVENDTLRKYKALTDSQVVKKLFIKEYPIGNTYLSFCCFLVWLPYDKIQVMLVFQVVFRKCVAWVDWTEGTSAHIVIETLHAKKTIKNVLVDKK